MRCPSLAVPSVSSVMICVWPRVKSAEPCVRGRRRPRTRSGRISSAPRPSGRRLSTAIFLPDELLVDRLGGLLDELARHAVLDGGLAVDRGRPDRERQLDGLDDAVEEQCRLADLSSFESCSASVRARRSSSNCSSTGPRPPRAAALENEVEARAYLQLADDLLLRRNPCRAAGRARRRSPRPWRPPRGGLPRRCARGCGPRSRSSRSLVVSAIEPLRLADLALQVLLRLAELDDLAVRELERFEMRSSGISSAPHSTIVRPSFVPTTIRSSFASSFRLRQRRVDDELVVDEPDAHRADRPEERQAARS